MKLSVVLPVLNEAASIAACLTPLQSSRRNDLEIILVDGGSEDQTVAVADPLVDRVLSSDRGRAAQMNAGWRAGKGKLIWFLHADSKIGRGHLETLCALAGSAHCWGRFDLRLSGERPIYRLIERAINWRSRLTGIATGDQAMFVSRSLLEEVGGYPEIALMEDVELSRRLKRYGRPKCLKPPVETSVRRWEREGVVRTVLLMWRLRFAYYFGADPQRLREIYRDVR